VYCFNSYLLCGEQYWLAAVNMAVTVPLMMVMVWVTASGLEKLKLTGLQRYERTVVGVMILLLGIGTLLWHHH
jgi:hypothetical protein